MAAAKNGDPRLRQRRRDAATWSATSPGGDLLANGLGASSDVMCTSVCSTNMTRSRGAGSPLAPHSASLCGAVSFLLLLRWLPDPQIALLAGAAVTLALRLAAVRWKLKLPVFKHRDVREE